MTGLADELLPKRQLADPHDNMQRLLRVLDRDGSAGLLSGAMDGGVPVELFRGRDTPYWAVFRVRRTRQGTSEGEAKDGRDMEYITSAAAQRADTRETSDTRTVEGSWPVRASRRAAAVRSRASAAPAGSASASAMSRSRPPWGAVRSA